MMADPGFRRGQAAACTYRPKSQTREDLRPYSVGIVLGRMRSVVFLRAYVDVALPIAEVEAQMAAGVENWMPELAKGANGDGEKLLSELGFNLGQRRIGRRIKVEIGEPKATAGLMFLPIRWQSATDAGLFPTLEGVLEVAALGTARTQLGLSANYDPPMGLIGKIADRALFHRVAEVTVKDFLERIGDRLVRDRVAK
jgi:hypothetical protein